MIAEPRPGSVRFRMAPLIALIKAAAKMAPALKASRTKALKSTIRATFCSTSISTSTTSVSSLRTRSTTTPRPLRLSRKRPSMELIARPMVPYRASRPIPPISFRASPTTSLTDSQGQIVLVVRAGASGSNVLRRCPLHHDSTFGLRQVWPLH
jgi:hypothetical protein